MTAVRGAIGAVAVLLALMNAGCSKGGLQIYAPPEFAEGDVIVDGAHVTKLSKPRYNYRWRGWKNLRDELSAPARHESFATIKELPYGAHNVSLVKNGYVPLTVRYSHEKGAPNIIDVWGAKVQRARASPTQ